MTQWAIFNGDSADWTEAEAMEAGFYSKEAAEAAMRAEYAEDDDAVVHEVEEPEEDEDEDDDEDGEEEVQS